MIKVLVVEDSEKDAFLYQKVLSKIKDAEVYYASSGEKAFDIAKQTLIDIFILDIELPGISGLELAGRIRNLPDYALTLILFITGYEKNQLEAFKQFHCYDYIVKPFGLHEFEKKITALIQQLSLTIHKTERVKMVLYPMMNKDILVPINQIKYAEVLHRRCYLYTDLQEEPFESSTITLKELLLEVDDPYFLQCHKSYAVNIKKIKEIDRLNYRLWNITLWDSKNKLYIGNKFYDFIYEQLNAWVAEKRE